MNLPGIPSVIKRQDVLDWLKSLGFDPDSLVKFEIDINGIYAEQYALNKDGYRYINAKNKAAMHIIAIPFDEQPARFLPGFDKSHKTRLWQRLTGHK